jgi:hypothetical protein
MNAESAGCFSSTMQDSAIGVNKSLHLFIRFFSCYYSWILESRTDRWTHRIFVLSMRCEFITRLTVTLDSETITWDILTPFAYELRIDSSQGLVIKSQLCAIIPVRPITSPANWQLFTSSSIL